MKWTHLRPIQVDAIRAILCGEDHLMITADTAGGKTEAAFLPILSAIVSSPGGSVRAIYVGPLKALINDQFERLERLCERSEIPVHRWHGDVGQASKKSLLREPGGVLLITPESIEALFVNHPNDLPRLFGRLSFIVIDELHSFIGTERGAHLKSLLSRLTAKSSDKVRLVCLSATLGEVELAKRWLSPREAASIRHISDEHAGREIRLVVKGYLGDLTNSRVSRDASNGQEVDHTCEDEEARLAGDLFNAFYGKTALIFANSRASLESWADKARQECARRQIPDRFWIHHGSLSKAVREEAEEALKSDSTSAAFCSSTLEMGIDVGRITEIGQIDPPWSVNSLVQRLGRSGRGEGEASIMRMFVVENAPDESACLFQHLFPRLLQAIAMTELMLSRWCEPPDVDRLHLSTLIQQILSVIVERGGASASRLFETLVVRGAFANVSQADFIGVLRCMAPADLIEQTSEGDLILGLEGEKTVARYEFYSAFLSSDEFRVLNGSHLIGMVSLQGGLEADEYLILAGRRWRILEVYLESKEIAVEPAEGARLPSFDGGMATDIHARVREKMCVILHSEEFPAYLDSKARDMLGAARRKARALGPSRHPFFQEGRDTLWFTWTSSRINRTLALYGRSMGLNVTDEGIGLVFHGVSLGEIAAAYAALQREPPDPTNLASHFPVKTTEKYDAFLSEGFQCRLIARSCLDVPGAVSLAKKAFSEGTSLPSGNP